MVATKLPRSKQHRFPEDDFHLCLEVDVVDFLPLIYEGKIIKNTQLIIQFKNPLKQTRKNLFL